MLKLPENKLFLTAVTNERPDETSIPPLQATTFNSQNISFSSKAAQNKQIDALARAKKREELLPDFEIISFQIKYYSYDELKATSVVQVSKELKTSNSDEDPENQNDALLINTVYDKRMGVYSDVKTCTTCNQNTMNCTGHHGHIDLAAPILHPQGITPIVKILKCICNDCTHLLLTATEIRNRGILRKTGKARLDALVDASKGAACSQGKGCNPNPTFATKKTNDQNSGKLIAEYKKGTQKTQVTYTAAEILERFKAISQEDIELLGFENGSSPKDLILEGLYVIPTISRAPIIRDGIITPHDLTVMYDNIVKTNNLLAAEIKKNQDYQNESTRIDIRIKRLQAFMREIEEERIRQITILELEARKSTISQDQKTRLEQIREYKDPEASIRSYQQQLNRLATDRSREKNSRSSKNPSQDELYIDLYNKVQHFMNNSDEAYTKRGDKSYKSIKQHITGKDEVIRGNIMGKRVNYAGRTVLSPDPNLKFGQIRVPRIWASLLTQKVKVYSGNLEYVRKLYENDKIAFITTNSDNTFKGIRRAITKKNKALIIVQEGDEVERHLQDGDIVLFNRQPTIQKESMLGYEVLLSDESTLGLHPSVCKAHNADNDGDEGNMHALQTIEAVVEAKRIANSKNCIMNAQSNRNIMNVHMDPVQACYMMTRDRNTVIPAEDFIDAMNTITYLDDAITFGDRLQKYQVLSQTGPALFSALLPADLFYTKGNVRILEGILVAGTITTDHIGNSSNSIIEVIYKIYGSQRASAFITDCSYVGNRYVLSFPFSVKYSDCIIEGDEVQKAIQNKTKSAKIAIDAIERKRELRRRQERAKGLKDNLLETEREEKEIINILNDTRNIGSKITKEYLDPFNGFYISAMSKVKGDVFNIAQITALIGQQYINNKRLEKTMTNKTRCSPYFAPGDTSIEAQGFCTGNFFQGLTPAEQFFLQTGSRENQVEATLKIPTSGDINHRMVKNFEDIILASNGNVINSRDRILQFSYEDGFGSDEMVFNNTRLGRLLMPIYPKLLADSLNVKYGYKSSNI